MANIKISQMTAAASASGTQEYEVNDGGTTKKVTGAQIAAYVNGELTLADLGITSSAAEINYTDITTLGTSEASKAVTADANGDVTLAAELKATSYNETYVSLTAAATVDVNCETGNVFALTTDQNTTFTFSNPPASGTAYGFTLKVTAGGTHTLTWPGTVDWAGGSAPDAPASGETNVLVFITHDGGTTWYGFQGGAAMA